MTESITSFCKVFPRKADSIDYGTITTQPTDNKLPALFDFKNSALDYFTCTAISDDAMIGGEFLLDFYSTNNIVKRSEGWVDENWTKTWIPLADRNGDLVFIKSELNTNNVYGVITGGFNPFLIADSLDSLFDVLTQCLKLEQQMDYETEDDDCEPLEEFITQVTQISSSSLTNEAHKGFMEFFF